MMWVYCSVTLYNCTKCHENSTRGTLLNQLVDVTFINANIDINSCRVALGRTVTKACIERIYIYCRESHRSAVSR